MTGSIERQRIHGSLTSQGLDCAHLSPRRRTPRAGCSPLDRGYSAGVRWLWAAARVLSKVARGLFVLLLVAIPVPVAALFARPGKKDQRAVPSQLLRKE